MYALLLCKPMKNCFPEMLFQFQKLVQACSLLEDFFLSFKIVGLGAAELTLGRGLIAQLGRKGSGGVLLPSN